MKKTNSSTENSSINSPTAEKNKPHRFWRWFWLSFLVVSLAYAWYSFYVPSNNAVWFDGFVPAQELANESDKNMLLFFTGEWCVPCRIMKREVFADEEVKKVINLQVVPVMINIDDPNVKELVERYQISGTPVIIFTDPTGNVLDYAVGKIGKKQLLKMIEKLGAVDS